VDALRALMVIGGKSSYGAGIDLAVLLLATSAFVIVAARLYPNVAR
jgi:hypothetical protein